MRRKLLTVVAAAAFGVLIAGPASADSLFSLYFGSYAPHSDAASRGVTDTFVSDAAAGESLDLKAFKHYIVGFDGVSRAGEHIEISLGAGYYNQSVIGNYFGSSITNKLMLAPATATVRYMPLTIDMPVHPYIGGGVAVTFWRLGYEDSLGAENDMGVAVGPVFTLGARVPISDTALSVGGELRWQGGRGTTSADGFFHGATVDVGGRTMLLTLSFGR